MCLVQVLDKQQIIQENAVKQCKDEATIQVGGISKVLCGGNEMLYFFL